MHLGFNGRKEFLFFFCAGLFLLFFAGGALAAPQIKLAAECDINSLSAKDIALDENVSIVYSCAPASGFSVQADLNILNKAGNVIYSSSIACGTASTTFTGFSLGDDRTPGLYVARLATATCAKDAFFTVATSNKAQGVADNNWLGLFGLLALVLVIIYPRKGK